MFIFLLWLFKENPVITLPAPQFDGKPLEECIARRRSIRNFKNADLTEQQIANLLWAAQGITDSTRGLRAAPSAGATYPLEVFVAKNDGLFRYLPKTHQLRREKSTDLRKEIGRAALDQEFIADAGVVIVIAAVPERTARRYGERAEQYIACEVGHCAQNIHLAAVALGLGSVPVGAFDEKKLHAALGLTGEEPMYVVPVGVPE